MELYLLKSTICLGILFVFYKLLLENSSTHQFKRFYLLGSLVAALLIPLLTFTTYVEPSPIIPIFTLGSEQILATDTKESINYWPIVLGTIYGIGVLFFSVKFFRNLFAIIQKIRQNPKYRNNHFINILLSEAVIPHTFLNYIFLNKQQFEIGEIPVEVMIHEEAHASQKHSLDIILIEIFKIVFWFNPLFYFLKTSIKLNHEFLADQAVLKNGIDTSTYQKLLLAFSTPNYSSDNLTPSLAHSINYSSMKKRFSIMKTNTTRRAILLRSLLILPLLSFLIYGFSTTETVAVKYQTTDFNNEKPLLKVHVIGEKITVNDKETTISNFTAAVDAVTKSWNKNDYELYRLDIHEENISDVYRKLINAAYRKTNLAKQSDYNRDFILGSLEGIPTPPAPPAIYGNMPGPKQPIEHVLAMAKHNAKFLYQSKTISVNQAVELLNNNKNLAVRTELKDPIPPMVFIYKKSNNPIIQQKATKAEVKEYNKLAKKYNSIDIEKRTIKKEDLERLEAIYNKMTDAQKENAEPFPKNIPPPPPNKTGYNFNKNINTNIPVPPTPSFYNDNKNVKTDGSAIFMYEDSVITLEKANELLFNNQNEIFTLVSKESGQEVIRLSKSPMKDGEKYHPFSPVPSSLTLTDKGLDPKSGINDATYYYNEMIISPEKANELLENNPNLRVYIDKTTDGEGTIVLYKNTSGENKIILPTPPSAPVTPKPNSPNKNN